MILRPTRGPEDWKAFLAKPDLHWKPERSAMETAYAWEHANGLPHELATLIPGAELLFAIPEFKVALPGGGADSQNDVFALLRDDRGLIVCMVEAKRDEPFGPTLGDWLRDASAGKTERLAAICAMLDVDQTRLDPTLRYQLFHRTASAIVTAQRYLTARTAMIVQSFSPEKRWFNDFARFSDILGIEARPDQPMPVDLPGGLKLTLGWASAPFRTEGRTS